MVIFILFLFEILNANASASQPQVIFVPESLSNNLKSFEPSAALYLADLNQFLLACDDTNKKDEPLLFLMNRQGQVDNAAVKIGGILKMTDMESISQGEDGSIYLMSSQGLNKNGKEKSERNIFIRASRVGRNINAIDSIELRPLLLKSLNGSQYAKFIDIESHFVRDDELYIGLKTPQPKPGMAEILNIGNVKKIFSHQELNVKTWRAINFSAVSGEEDLLSDIYPLDGKLYLATTQEVGPGRFWQYEESTGELVILREFSNYRPEGIAFDPQKKIFTLFFDQGGSEAFYLDY